MERRNRYHCAGWTVLEASRGEVGLALCGERDPGLVLLDLRMPGMDGLDVLTALVEKHAETPVIVISGHGTMNDAMQASDVVERVHAEDMDVIRSTPKQFNDVRREMVVKWTKVVKQTGLVAD